MATGILILFCVALLNFGISTSSKLTLKHVVVTFRSGEHTPCDFWDVPKITNISESNSTLTTKGVDSAYKLGQTLGEHYKNNFSLSQWNSSNYYSMGTRAPRCLMSAFNFGAGLENNVTGKVKNWTEKEKQRVEQEKTIFPHTDQYMMFLNTTKCPAFYTALGQEIQKKLQKKLDQYSSKITDVTRMYSTVNTSQPFTVWLGYETLQTMNETNSSSTEWITNSTWQGLEDYSEEYILGVESADKLKKLSGGIMLDSIFNVTQKIIKGKQPQGKDDKHSHVMSVLATSQAPLAAMLGAFTTNETTYNGEPFKPENFYPKNGAHHIVEIYGKDGGSESDFKLRVLYSPGGPGSSLSPLKYPGCDDDDKCPFDKLKETLKGFRLPGKNQEKACQGNNSRKSPKQ